MVVYHVAIVCETHLPMHDVSNYCCSRRHRPHCAVQAALTDNLPVIWPADIGGLLQLSYSKGCCKALDGEYGSAAGAPLSLLFGTSTVTW